MVISMTDLIFHSKYLLQRGFSDCVYFPKLQESCYKIRLTGQVVELLGLQGSCHGPTGPLYPKIHHGRLRQMASHVQHGAKSDSVVSMEKIRGLRTNTCKQLNARIVQSGEQLSPGWLVLIFFPEFCLGYYYLICLLD